MGIQGTWTHGERGTSARSSELIERDPTNVRVAVASFSPQRTVVVAIPVRLFVVTASPSPSVGRRRRPPLLFFYLATSTFCSKRNTHTERRGVLFRSRLRVCTMNSRRTLKLLGARGDGRADLNAVAAATGANPP